MNAAYQHLDLQALNKEFKPLSPAQRIMRLYNLVQQNDVMYTSSFGTTAVMLLHLISQFRKQQKVHFINTTFHFNETLQYKQLLTEKLGLKVLEVLPDVTQNEITRRDRSWEHEPDLCCMVNKVITLDSVKVNYKVWITGMMAYQTHFRLGMDIFTWQDSWLKFNPLIDVSASDWASYVKQHNLPKHPLLAEGYGSVGCTHCTLKGQGRNGRWANQSKTECGLHSQNKIVIK